MTTSKYLLTRFLLIALFILESFVPIGVMATDRCDGFKISVVINQSNELEVAVSGAQGKARVYIIDSNEKLVNSKDIFSYKYSGLKSGSYKLIVADLSGCSKETEFTIR
jgi:hypothetical protein